MDFKWYTVIIWMHRVVIILSATRLGGNSHISPTAFWWLPRREDVVYENLQGKFFNLVQFDNKKSALKSVLLTLFQKYCTVLCALNSVIKDETVIMHVPMHGLYTINRIIFTTPYIIALVFIESVFILYMLFFINLLYFIFMYFPSP